MIRKAKIFIKFARFSHAKRRRIISILENIDRASRVDIPDDAWINIYKSAYKHAPTLGALRCACKRFTVILPRVEVVLDKDGNIGPWLRRLCFALNRRPGFIGEVFYKAEQTRNPKETLIILYQKPALWEDVFEPLIFISKISGYILSKHYVQFTWPAHISDEKILDVFQLNPYEQVTYYKVKYSEITPDDRQKFDSRHAIHMKWCDTVSHNRKTADEVEFLKAHAHKIVVY